MWYSIEPRARIYFIGYWYLSFARNLSNKYKNQLLDTGLDFFKNWFQKSIPESKSIFRKQNYR